MRVAGDEVPERAHGLRAEMPAPADVVVHYAAHAARFAAAVGTVDIVDHGAEHCRIGHLPAYNTGFDFGAAQVFPELFFEQPLHLGDEIRPLVIKYLGVIESLRLFVLGIPEGGVRYGEQADHRGSRHLGGYQVDALMLAPPGIFHGLAQKDLPDLRQQARGLRTGSTCSPRRCKRFERTTLAAAPRLMAANIWMGPGGRIGPEMVFHHDAHPPSCPEYRRQFSSSTLAVQYAKHMARSLCSPVSPGQQSFSSKPR